MSTGVHIRKNASTRSFFNKYIFQTSNPESLNIPKRFIKKWEASQLPKHFSDTYIMPVRLLGKTPRKICVTKRAHGPHAHGAHHHSCRVSHDGSPFFSTCVHFITLFSACQHFFSLFPQFGKNIHEQAIIMQVLVKQHKKFIVISRFRPSKRLLYVYFSAKTPN